MAMEKRRGVSLSSKMIATTTALILGIVALFGYLNAQQNAKVFDEQSGRLREISIDNLRKRGDVQTRDLVQAGGTALVNNDYSALRHFMSQLHDASKDDAEFAYAFIADKDGQIFAHTDAALNTTQQKV